MRAFAGTPAALVVGLLIALGGCVHPGRVDPELLVRYQKAMAARSPQKRRGPADLPMLLPAPGATGPVLEILKDEKTGRPRVDLTLQQAIMWALVNNPDIAVVSFDPAISREEMMQAAAAFDYTVFGGYTRTDDDRRPEGPFAPLLANRTITDEMSAGVRQRAVTGAEWALQLDMTRTWDDSGIDTRYEPDLTLSLTQPLLRDAWPTFNLATLRIARINHKVSLARFRDTVQGAVAETIGAYWRLVQRRRNQEIEKALLDMTKETLKKVEARADLDATAVEINQIKASVEQRRAVYIRGGKDVLDAQQELARLLAHEQINVLTDYEILPVTAPATAPVRIDPEDQLVAALRHNPVLEQARYQIAIAGENVKVARNQLLPRLDLAASAGLMGTGENWHFAWDQFNTGGYFSYSLGLAFEYPLGNREREAALRQSQLERRRAVSQKQVVADDLAVAVSERIREIHTALEELQAQRAAVDAARKHLEALEATEIRGRLTPEYLNVKLTAQRNLALAEIDQLQAIISYNTALADLARATGTVLELNGVKLSMPEALAEPR